MNQEIKEIDIIKHYETAKLRLEEIWSELGLTENCLKERQIAFPQHLKKFVDEIVNEEEECLKALKESIPLKQKQLDDLCVQLDVPPYQPDHDLKLMSIDTDLSEKLVFLSHEKAKRVEKKRKLLKEDEEMCCLLNKAPYYCLSDSAPTHQTLSDLEGHLKMLRKVKSERESLFEESKNQIIVNLNLLDVRPANQFEKDLVQQTTQTFVPNDLNMTLLEECRLRLQKRLNENKAKSMEQMKTLKELWCQLNISQQHQHTFLLNNTSLKQECIVALQEEVNRCKVLKLQNSEKELISLKVKLEKIWEKCYVGEDEKKSFESYNHDTLNSDNLSMIESYKDEIKRMREYFSERESLINKVKQYDHLWKQYLDFEENVSKPGRLFDKGWSLLKEEAERNKVRKELPKMEFNIEEDIKEWNSNTGQVFTVMGEEFEKWVKGRWSDLKKKKQTEKELRNQAKQKRLEQEHIYGCKSPHVTPSKRFYTPAKNTPSKSRRVLQAFDNNSTQQQQPKQLNYDQQNTTTAFLLSDTIVSAHQIQQHEPDVTMALDKYNDFEIMVNEEVRYKARSSMMPQYHEDGDGDEDGDGENEEE